MSLKGFSKYLLKITLLVSCRDWGGTDHRDVGHFFLSIRRISKIYNSVC